MGVVPKPENAKVRMNGPDLISPPRCRLGLAWLILSLLTITTNTGAANLAALESTRPPSFATIAKKTMPVVVNISTSLQRSARSGSNDPIDEFFNRFFGETIPRESNQRSLGSGILISKDGEILTNYHVVRSADTIKVKLADQTEYEARLVGKDDRTDIALIKIRKSGGNLPFAKLGISSQLTYDQDGSFIPCIIRPVHLAVLEEPGPRPIDARRSPVGVTPFT